MKSMTFDEFFAMPPGTVFGQATGLPHQFSTGLYRKGESYPEDDGEGRCIIIENLIDDGEGSSSGEYGMYPDEGVFDDYRFLVYEPDDLDRLAGLIGRGPGLVTPGPPNNSVAIREMPEGELDVHVYDKIQSGWAAWIDDPAPKLDGLRLSVWPGRAVTGSVELVLTRGSGSSKWESLRTLFHPENDRHDNLSAVVFGAIDIMHAEAIRDLRTEHRKDRPGRGPGWVAHEGGEGGR